MSEITQFSDMRSPPCPHGGGLKGKTFEVQLDTPLFISSLVLVLCFILYLIKAKRVYRFGKLHFPVVVACYVTHHRDLLLSLGKKTYVHNWHMLHLAATILQNLVAIFVQIEIYFKNDFLFFLGQDADLHFCLCLSQVSFNS